MRCTNYVLVLCVVVCIRAHECDLIDTLVQYGGVPISENVQKKLYALASLDRADEREKCMLHADDKSLLHIMFPSLQKTIPYRALGDLPTPVARLSKLEEQTKSCTSLYIKRDDLTGYCQNNRRAFGGNKIRKLEFLLADALAHGSASVITYGAIGSNHVVATTASCKQLGLSCIALLVPQEVTAIVKRNMLLMHEYGANMMLMPDRETRMMQTICLLMQRKYTSEPFPYFIPTGGSCPVGIAGFVNAAFELRSQIERGLLPEPDYIYVAMGSMGTTVGLVLGIRAAGLKSQVIPVAVEPDSVSYPFAVRIVRLLNLTNEFLHEKAPEFPLFQWDEYAVQMRFEFSGSAYGSVTPEALQAIEVVRETEGIVLDSTYTGKAFAALLHDLESGMLDGKNVLFWNTFCDGSTPSNSDYKNLSREFHQYFM